jgi:hypothetical protein
MRPPAPRVHVLFMVAVVCTAGVTTVWALPKNELASLPSLSSSYSLAVNDTLRPEISGWGLEGPVAQGLSFSAWANVTDSESGVRNVSLSVLNNTGYRSQYVLGFNGSLYRASIAGLALNAIYTLTVIAFDVANNSATSYQRTVDLRPTASATIDESATAPIVIGSSLVLMGVVAVLATIYDRKRGAPTQSWDPCASRLVHQFQVRT